MRMKIKAVKAKKIFPTGADPRELSRFENSITTSFLL